MKKILCVGTLIADIIHEKVDRLPNEGECISTRVSLNLGGNAYSSTVNLMRLSTDNITVHCYGLIGEDNIGSLFESALAKEGVVCHFNRVPDKKTACNLILQEEGKERRFLLDAGANVSAKQRDILRLIDQIKPDVVVFGELPSLGIVGSEFLEIVNYIKSIRDCIICLDTLVTPEEDYGWMKSNWNKIDIVHCNVGEGIHISQTKTSPEICAWFIKNGVGLSIVSEGEKGCYFGHQNQMEHLSALQVKELDATGAGDAMLAGIITKLLEQKANNLAELKPTQVRDMVEYGSACGAFAVRSIGCVSDISKSKVLDLMNSK
jgi:fructokinase